MEDKAYVWKEIKKYNDEREICVICGAEVEYYRETPISKRENYVEVCGQLCRSCAISLWISKKR